MVHKLQETLLVCKGHWREEEEEQSGRRERGEGRGREEEQKGRRIGREGGRSEGEEGKVSG